MSGFFASLAAKVSAVASEVRGKVLEVAHEIREEESVFDERSEPDGPRRVELFGGSPAYRAALQRLSEKDSNFTRSAPEGFAFKLKDRVGDAKSALEFDPKLKERRFALVPRFVTEEAFWRNYFYHVEKLHQSYHTAAGRAAAAAAATAAASSAADASSSADASAFPVPPTAAPAAAHSSSSHVSDEEMRQQLQRELKLDGSAPGSRRQSAPTSASEAMRVPPPAAASAAATTAATAAAGTAAPVAEAPAQGAEADWENEVNRELANLETVLDSAQGVNWDNLDEGELQAAATDAMAFFEDLQSGETSAAPPPAGP